MEHGVLENSLVCHGLTTLATTLSDHSTFVKYINAKIILYSRQTIGARARAASSGCESAGIPGSRGAFQDFSEPGAAQNHSPLICELLVAAYGIERLRLSHFLR